jgi:hypothetical protein
MNALIVYQECMLTSRLNAVSEIFLSELKKQIFVLPPGPS